MVTGMTTNQNSEPHARITALEGPDLDVTLHHGAFGRAEADSFLSALRNGVAWQQDDICIFGQTHPLPRLTAWYGESGISFTYSGIQMAPAVWNDDLVTIRDRVAALAGSSFNSVLLNLYRNGSDSVGWHSDDQQVLGVHPVIGSLSLGAARRFQLRRHDNHACKRELTLHHGDLLLMSGSTQQRWQHQVPKTSRPTGERISLTFRTTAR